MIRIAAATLALFAVAACASSNHAPGSATLEGTVHGPAALTVDVPGTALSTRADGKGHFALLDVREGSTSVHFSGPGVDARLSIAPLSGREHRSISVSVFGNVAIEHHEVYDVELRGVIDSISAPSFVVAGKTVNTTAATTFEKAGAAIAFADLKAGDMIEAEATTQADGSLLARSVEIEDSAEAEADAGNPEDVTLDGTLSAVNGNQLTVGTTTVTTDAATRIEKDDQAVSASALAVGDQLRVEGIPQADGSVVAEEIQVVSAEEEPQVEVKGAIEQLSADSIQVEGKIFMVDAGVRIDESGNAIPFSSLEIGRIADVRGTIDNDAALHATRISLDNSR